MQQWLHIVKHAYKIINNFANTMLHQSKISSWNIIKIYNWFVDVKYIKKKLTTVAHLALRPIERQTDRKRNTETDDGHAPTHATAKCDPRMPKKGQKLVLVYSHACICNGKLRILVCVLRSNTVFVYTDKDWQWGWCEEKKGGFRPVWWSSQWANNYSQCKQTVYILAYTQMHHS